MRRIDGWGSTRWEVVGFEEIGDRTSRMDKGEGPAPVGDAGPFVLESPAQGIFLIEESDELSKGNGAGDEVEGEGEFKGIEAIGQQPADAQEPGAEQNAFLYSAVCSLAWRARD